jgi:hypothetical protein
MNNIYTNVDGILISYKKGKYHSFNDRPAVIFPNGYKAWYENGILHKKRGPAIITDKGVKVYYVNGQFKKIE